MSRSLVLVAVAGLLLVLALAPSSLGDRSKLGANLVQILPMPAPGFRLAGDQVIGTHVAFTYNYTSSAGPIQDFTYVSTQKGYPEPELIFQAVTISGYRGTGRPTVDGSLFKADGGVADLTVRDNAAAPLQILAKGPLRVVFTLAPGVELESEDSGLSQLRCLSLEKPVRAAIFSPEGSMVIQSNRVVVTPGGAGLVLFRAVPPKSAEGSSGDEHAVCEAIAKGKVAAEVNIGLTLSGLKVDSVQYRADTKVEVVNAARHHLEVRVKGMRPGGTRVALRLDSSVVTAEEGRVLRVSLDGVPVSSDSVTNVLYAHGNNTQDARYSALVQGPGLGLLVYIPRLTAGGVNLIIDAILPVDPWSDPLTLGVMAIGVAVVALATVALFRRRH